MPSKLLFNNGNLVLRTGSVQVIPDGMNASDCTCCGAGCETCPSHPDGPFSRGKITAAISGMPNVIQFAFMVFDFASGEWWRVSLSVTGLAWFNQTFYMIQDNNCDWIEYQSSSTANVAFYYERLTSGGNWMQPNPPEDYCSIDPPIYFVIDDFSEVTTVTIGVAFAYPWGFTLTIPIPLFTCTRLPFGGIGQQFTIPLFGISEYECIDQIVPISRYCELMFPPGYENDLCYRYCCFDDQTSFGEIAFTWSEAP